MWRVHARGTAGINLVRAGLRFVHYETDENVRVAR